MVPFKPLKAYLKLPFLFSSVSLSSFPFTIRSFPLLFPTSFPFPLSFFHFPLPLSPSPLRENKWTKRVVWGMRGFPLSLPFSSPSPSPSPIFLFPFPFPLSNYCQFLSSDLYLPFTLCFPFNFFFPFPSFPFHFILSSPPLSFPIPFYFLFIPLSFSSFSPPL